MSDLIIQPKAPVPSDFPVLYHLKNPTGNLVASGHDGPAMAKMVEEQVMRLYEDHKDFTVTIEQTMIIGHPVHIATLDVETFRKLVADNHF